MKMTTLCYIEKDGCYLMLHRTKKEKDINKGKWIGVGGHAYDGETPEECITESSGISCYVWKTDQFKIDKLDIYISKW